MPNHRRGRGRGAPVRGGHAAPGAGRGEGPRAPAAGGVFTRLRLSCPEILTSNTPMGYSSYKIPITFWGLPDHMRDMCHEMSIIKSRSQSSSDSDNVDTLDPVNETNMAVLIKGGLILAELKVRIVSYAVSDFYSHDQRHKFYPMAQLLPKPLVEYLDCIGTVHEGFSEVTPVLAQGGRAGGAPALAPSQLAPLLARLHRGVDAAAAADAKAALATLPLRWEQHGGQLRLSEESFRFWVAVSGPADAPRHAIRWTNEDDSRFRNIIYSVRNCKDGRDYIVDVGQCLSRGMGSPAQFVQTPEWKVGGTFKWFTVIEIDDEHIDKGVAFGFGSFDSSQAQPSRLTGTLETCYRSGESRRLWSGGFRGQNIQWSLNISKAAMDPQFGTIIPITFSTLHRYVDLICNAVLPSGNNSAAATAVFTKAALILAEAKVYFAQMASKYTMLHPEQMVKYSSEQVDVLKRMPMWLPKPLAVYLECIGVTSTGARRQEVTPVLADGSAADFRWTDEDSRLFQAAIRSMRGDHLVYTDLTHGQGSPAQFVQCVTADGYDQWYVMTDIDDVSLKLGVAFRFGDLAGRQVPPTRLTGSFDTAFRRSGFMNRSLNVQNIINVIIP